MKTIKKFLKIMILVLFIFNLVVNVEIFADDNVVEQEDLFKNISAPNLLIAENNKDGEILYQREIKEKIYPASITKLMSSILVVDNC